METISTQTCVISNCQFFLTQFVLINKHLYTIYSIIIRFVLC